MRVRVVTLVWLLGFWQANTSEPDTAYEIGRAIGFCMGPVLLLLIVIMIVFVLYKRSKNKGANK